MEYEGDGDTDCNWCAPRTPIWQRLEKNWKSEEEVRSSRSQHYWDQSEYSEESWRPQETCCHLDSRERPLAYAAVKNSSEKLKEEEEEEIGGKERNEIRSSKCFSQIILPRLQFIM